MEMYKKAAFIGLRIPTQKGLLSVEQVCSLSLKDLIIAIKSLNEVLNKNLGSNLDFLDEVESADPLKELAFEIMKDVYTTKKEESKKLSDDASIRESNKKILEIIARKQDQQLEAKSIPELEKLIIKK